MKWSHAHTPWYPAASRRRALSSHQPGSARIVRSVTPIGRVIVVHRERAAERGRTVLRGVLGPKPDRVRLTSKPRLEQSDVLGRGRMAVAAGVFERRPRPERVEIRREPPDHVEDDLLDALRVLREDLQDRS